MIDSDDTIVAIASPTTPAPRGIVRVSGKDVTAILNRLSIDVPSKRAAISFATKIQTAPPIGLVDVRLSLWQTKRSYTGQPSAEFHSYGSLPVLQSIVDAIVDAGARPARPGEFTMRAFLAGRLDLTQAEAVLGVIDAQHRGSLDHALRQLSGNLSRPLEQVRGTILDLLADVEAGLDFVDEDIEFVSDETLVERLGEIVVQLQQTQKTMLSRDGVSTRTVIALRGKPNAGKSRLLNRLVQRDAAIVADVAGTTRDIVTVDDDLGGLPVQFVDTAGIEDVLGDDSEAKISQHSQDQADRASDEASIRIWCVDATRTDLESACNQLTHAAESRRQSVQDIFIGTKSDLVDAGQMPDGWIATSSVSGAGIDALQESIRHAIVGIDSEETGSVVGTAARCRGTLANAITAIDQAIQLTKATQGHEFVSAELRTAAACIGEVTGAVYTDDILDRVFSRFCIGK